MRMRQEPRGRSSEDARAHRPHNNCTEIPVFVIQLDSMAHAKSRILEMLNFVSLRGSRPLSPPASRPFGAPLLVFRFPSFSKNGSLCGAFAFNRIFRPVNVH